MNSNLPTGASNHPDRPWETADVLCPNCDTEGIGEMVDQYLAANLDCVSAVSHGLLGALSAPAGKLLFISYRIKSVFKFSCLISSDKS